MSLTTDHPSNNTVAIFGEVLADIFPDQRILGGAPFNAARHMWVFGLNPVMISSIGADALGDELLAEMDKLGMDTSGIQFDPLHPTGQVKVQLENGSPSYEIVPDQAYDHINVAITQETVAEIRPAMAYFGTLVQRGMESRLAVEQFWRDCHCPKFLDINLREPWFDKDVIKNSLTAADIVKMNAEELQVVVGLLHLAGANQEAQALELQKRFNLRQVLVTCGDEGSWLLEEHGLILKADAAQLEQPFVDSVGAGDAYSAVFMLGLLKGWDMQLTLQRASRFASAICTVRGAVPPSLDFYAPFTREWA